MIRKEQPKGTVGEIDTSAPFQSVKQALNLFGQVAVSGEKTAIKKVKPHSAEEHIYVRDTQLHVAVKELEKLKERLRKAEDTKAEAAKKLEKASEEAEDLNQKLKAINESKEGSLKATEAANIQVKKIKEANTGSLVKENADLQQEMTTVREQHMKIVQEFSTAKQELTKIRHQYEVLKEISAVKEKFEQENQATMKAKRDLMKVLEEKAVQGRKYEANSEESGKKIKEMKNEFNPELMKHLKTQLAERLSEVSSFQKVESLKLELEKLRKEHAELREKEAKTESEAGNLNIKITKIKSELEIFLTSEDKARDALEEMMTTVNQLIAEKESAQEEAKKLKMEAEELEKETEATLSSLRKSEKLLKTTLEESDKAKASEEIAVEEIRSLSEITNTARSSASESGVKITLCRDEFESLSMKSKESENLALLKADAAMAQMKAVKASENEARRKLEATQNELKDVKACIEEAMKRTEIAEAAKKAIEGELKKWEGKEQMKHAEAVEQESAKNLPVNHKLQKQKSELPILPKKMERRRSLMSKKIMKPSFSSIFHRKNSQIDSGSPSHFL